ncbi:hypothetical protein [Paenibacillus polysaccharolyticus]|uniref:hypothetical protein n=1 Tax=Paenibacillus polysaccharolyticus TaxID=582692 RepID=UPI003340A7A0
MKMTIRSKVVGWKEGSFVPNGKASPLIPPHGASRKQRFSRQMKVYQYMIYAPGYNSFPVSEDEEETLFVFHARTYKNIIGDRCTFQIAYIRNSAFVDG